MNGERLELVTDFASLRMGVIVVGECWYCERRHRGMLIRFLDSHPRWEMAPNPHPEFSRVVISVECVRVRRVWRVVDGLEDPAETRDEKRPSRIEEWRRRVAEKESAR